MKKLDYPPWFFMWVSGEPYITSACGWHREDVRREIVGSYGGKLTWKEIYAMGGRIVRCKVTVKKKVRGQKWNTLKK